MTELNTKLTQIYSQRSDLAHGNYRENFNLDDIVESVYSLYLFNKHILNEYMKDRELVEYLKDN